MPFAMILKTYQIAMKNIIKYVQDLCINTTYCLEMLKKT